MNVDVDGLPPGQMWVSHRIADPQKRPRPLDTASWFAIGGLALVGLANLARVGAALALHGGAEPMGVAELQGLEDRYNTFVTWTSLTFVGDLLAAAMFIPWFAMAYGNLRRLGVQHLRWSNGWAVGAWFVPILGLVRPKQIANDIWRGTEPGADVGSERWRLLPVPSVVHWWWALFLIGGFVAGIGSSTTGSGYRGLVHAVQVGLEWGPSLAKVRTGSLIGVAGSACLVVAAALGAMFVHGVTQRFEAIRRQLILTEPVYMHMPAQDLVKCPECAEFVLPVGACRYCGYSFAGPPSR